jgi:hypothetical protein
VISLSPNKSASNTDYHATVTMTEPLDDSGPDQLRCVIDPPSPPATYADITPGCAFSGAGGDVTADGQHTIYAAGIDADGTTAGPVAQKTFTIDRDPPDTSLDVKPSDPSGPSVQFGFSGGTTYTCQLDAFTESCQPNKGYANLSDGQHTFTVTAIDAAGNSDPTPESYTWTVDATGPDTFIDQKPGDPSGPDVTFTYTSGGDAVGYRCTLDSGTTVDCNGGSKSYTGLSSGSHTFEVAGVDVFANEDASPAAYTWTVDATAPETQIDTKPTNPSGPDVEFEFSAPGGGQSTFTCTLDGTEADCGSGSASYNDLDEGDHTFTVAAVDSFGNTDTTPASYDWTVDAMGPVVTIVGPKKTTKRTPKFTFTSSEPDTRYLCSVDDPNGFVDCDTPYQTEKLKPGKHTLMVIGIDGFDNAGAEADWPFKIVKR